MSESSSGSWRRGWAGAGAILATLILIGLIAMVTLTNRQRDDALRWERHTYDVMFLTRTVDATLSRAEAALGRFVLDEQADKSGYTYSSEWQLAGRQINQLQRLVRADPKQREAVTELKELYERRGSELQPAAAAAVAKRGSDGPAYFWHAGLSETVPALRSKLDEIAANERQTLKRRTEETGFFSAEAERFTSLLGWMGMFIGVGAILLGMMAYRVLTDLIRAEEEVGAETVRAATLEEAVRARTQELSEANERLRAEAAERESAEAQLRQVQKMEAVGQLTGGIAHDFNNMLAVVVGGIDLARRRLGGPRKEVEYHLDSAMEGANRAAALTRRLLAFSRSEPLQPEALSPNKLVIGMLDLIDRTIGERIRVETDLRDQDWQIWADPSGLENAILNLAVNARDAMNGEGSMTIRVDTARVDTATATLQPGEYVRISVADTGSGITPENLEKVFEPFFTTKPVGKGTGLGLSQIFGFARQSGGDVTIESTVGVGTTVSVLLPRSNRVSRPDSGHAPGTSDEIEEAPEGTVILVVEDDPRVSRSTVSALEELGYRPIACDSGDAALAIIRRERRVDLVLTDVMMPGMTGTELVRTLAREFPDCAILFVTGYVGDAGEALELSDYDLLRKPFTVTALSKAVATALARRLSEPHRAEAAEAIA